MPTLRIPLKNNAKEKVNTRVWDWRGHGIDLGEEAEKWFSDYLGYPAKLLQFDKGKEIEIFFLLSCDVQNNYRQSLS